MSLDEWQELARRDRRRYDRAADVAALASIAFCLLLIIGLLVIPH